MAVHDSSLNWLTLTSESSILCSSDISHSCYAAFWDSWGLCSTSNVLPDLFGCSHYSAMVRSMHANLLPRKSGSRRQSTIAGMVLRKQNEIDIVLDGEAEFVHAYSTHDEIKGVVKLKSKMETPLAELIISFEGESTTYVENMASTAPNVGRTTGRHTFLKLLQPVDSNQLPASNLLKAGITYTVPFTFVVPDRLLPYICSHRVENETVRREHLQLPPSMGDHTISGDGHRLIDDLAPAMARISYGIRVCATSRLASGQLIEIAERVERVLIIPTKEEAPPVNVDEESCFIMRSEKPVWKGLFKIGKLGQITAETMQPRSLRLQHPHKKITESVTTTATLTMRFDPSRAEHLPPQLTNIVSKLRVYTFFGVAPYKRLPEAHHRDKWSSLHGWYPTTVELSSRNLSMVSWTKHEAGSLRNSSTASTDMSRRPLTFSNTSAAAIPEPSAGWKPAHPFYTASILVPVSLPSSSNTKNPKFLLPSFHSCIVSRSYMLELTVSYNTPGTSVSVPHITLKSPIQVSSEGGEAPASVAVDDDAVEFESQFGLYANTGLGLLSPNLEEAALLLQQRHASVTTGDPATVVAPPDYSVSSQFARTRTAMGGARMTSLRQRSYLPSHFSFE